MKQISAYKNEIVYSLASVISPVITMLSALVACRYIDPSDMGVMQGALLFVTYSTFLPLGVYNGLNRNIAYYKAKDNQEKVQSMVDTSFFVSYIVLSICSIAGLINLIWNLFCGDKIHIYAALLLFLSLIAGNFSTHYEVTYRSGQEFKRLASIKNKETLCTFVLMFLPILIQSLGYVISHSAKVLWGLVLRIKDSPYSYCKTQSWESYKELIRVGFPLMVGTYLWSLMAVADQSYIAVHMPSEQLGLYNIARQCTTVMMVVPTALSTLLYPKAAGIYGKNDTAQSLQKYWLKSLGLLSGVLIPIVVLSYLLLPFFVELVMPKYIGGIGAGRIAILTGLTYIYMGPSVIYGTIRKNIINIILIGLMVCLFWTLTSLFPAYYNSIESIAWLRFFLFFAYMLFTLCITFNYTRK